ncbi:MAG: hypothetical protein KDB04_10895 [Acidimicrobiales bacterium]|nr:hypothetical protein [Acidimicrobiales bacterium]HRW38778.1 hypothetical protein [Aquihabitans sp.]
MGDGTDEVELHLAFWNTWLLSPRLARRGPRLPDLGGWFGPDVARRAPLVGAAVRGRFDAVALSEVFEASEQDAVAGAWPEASFVAGPGAQRLRLQSSGLMALVAPGVELLRTERHAYRSGGDLRDSDTYATKGALLTTIRSRAGGPPVDLISTHLFAGGDLLPIPGADDAARHHLARMAQVDELVGFIERVHDPDHVLVVAGDLNVRADDPDPRLASPDERYRDLAAHLDRAGLHDVWADHGRGPGPTCTFADPADLPPDPDEPDRVVDRDDDASGERIDYLWLRIPPSIEGRVAVGRPRRWAFSGRGVRGGPAGSLSDHLALSVALHLPA